MPAFRMQDLIDCFHDENVHIRTAALTLLCDSYASSPEIMRGIIASWKQWGVDQAFDGFAMLTYLPACSELVSELCDRADEMVEGRKLTDPTTRAAGKLIEQQMQLPAAELHPHLNRLKAVVAKSKIFFRVDLGALSKRIELLDRSADSLANVLDSSLEAISNNPNNNDANHNALFALEALRRQHPSYIDLAMVLSTAPRERQRSWGGFNTTLQSLIQFPGDGLEQPLGTLLLDEREYVFTMALESLVRCGTQTAANVLLERFQEASPQVKHWIARGLQRIRQPRLSSRISELIGVEPSVDDALIMAMLSQLDDPDSLESRIPELSVLSSRHLGLILLNLRLLPSPSPTLKNMLEAIAIQLRKAT
jgi:hypothetical protein